MSHLTFFYINFFFKLFPPFTNFQLIMEDSFDNGAPIDISKISYSILGFWCYLNNLPDKLLINSWPSTQFDDDRVEQLLGYKTE